MITINVRAALFVFRRSAEMMDCAKEMMSWKRLRLAGPCLYITLLFLLADTL